MRIIAITIFLLVTFFLASPTSATAQSCNVCSPNDTCSQTFDPLTGRFIASCNRDTNCRNVSCTPNGSRCEYFSFSASCTILSDGSCDLQTGSVPGSCPYIAPTVPPSATPPPTGGGGTPPPGVCSGACFGGISNCGEVGRVPGAGSCSTGGELCCNLPGGGGASCTPNNNVPPNCTTMGNTPGPEGCCLGLTGVTGVCRCPEAGRCIVTLVPQNVTVQPNQSVALIAEAEKYPGSNGYGYKYATFRLNNGAIGTINPTQRDGVGFDSYLFNTSFDAGASEGASRWYADVYMGDITDRPYLACSASGDINVQNSSSGAITVDLKINGSDGPVTLSNTYPQNVLVTWTSTNASRCTFIGSPSSPSAAWNGNKGVSGSATYSIPAAVNSFNYRLTCYDDYNSADDVIQVNVPSRPPAPTTCRVSAPESPRPIPVERGKTTTMNPIVTIVGSGATISSLRYSSQDTTRFTVTPAISSVSPYTATIRGIIPSWRILDIQAVLSNNQSCSARRAVTTIEWLCGIPTPHDPPTQQCPSSPTATDGLITWEWDAVPGAAQYWLEVREQGTNVLTYSSGWRAASFFGVPCTTGGACNYTTPNLSAKRYYSQIKARGSSGQCSDSGWSAPAIVDLQACSYKAWWQVTDGDVIAGSGNIVSEIPSGCTAPTCRDNLILPGDGGSPGLIIRSGTVNTGSGTVSATNWSAQTGFGGRVPDYEYFESLIPVGITPTDPGASAGGNVLASGGSSSGGYTWYRRNGNFTLTSDLSVPANRKVVLFVDGDVTLNGRITLTNLNTSFFMLVASGNVTVGPTVTSSGSAPSITGIFFNEGIFSTSVASVRLNVLGSVVSLGGVRLERDLGGVNSTTPAESFNFSPEILSNYPPTLSAKRPVWREIAP